MTLLFPILIFLNLCCLWFGLYGLSAAKNEDQRMMSALLSTLSILMLVLQILLAR